MISLAFISAEYAKEGTELEILWGTPGTRQMKVRAKVARFPYNQDYIRKAWIEAALEDGVEIHEPDSLEDYSGQFKLRIPRSLHRSLAEHSQREGISMNQYCVYLLSRNDAVFSK